MRTQSFSSLGKFAEHLAIASFETALKLHEGLKSAAVRVEQSAKSEIGNYQDAAGPFPEWAQLAEATENDKERKGYDLNAPLLREGALRDSYTHKVSALEAVIGSPLELAVWQEMGTGHIPPRPVLGPAAFRNKLYIERRIGEAFLAGITRTRFDAMQKNIAGYEPA